VGTVTPLTIRWKLDAHPAPSSTVPFWFVKLPAHACDWHPGSAWNTRQVENERTENDTHNYAADALAFVDDFRVHIAIEHVNHSAVTKSIVPELLFHRCGEALQLPSIPKGKPQHIPSKAGHQQQGTALPPSACDQEKWG
jgi:hypothetical protein